MLGKILIVATVLFCSPALQAAKPVYELQSFTRLDFELGHLTRQEGIVLATLLRNKKPAYVVAYHQDGKLGPWNPAPKEYFERQIKFAKSLSVQPRLAAQFLQCRSKVSVVTQSNGPKPKKKTACLERLDSAKRAQALETLSELRAYARGSFAEALKK
ncbi:MAG TPA: hypothetical protein VFV50_06605 [Bdellovibrionales bacterium]|nr:hypothetical protein [Bdellovibrionales bacterium]